MSESAVGKKNEKTRAAVSHFLILFPLWLFSCPLIHISISTPPPLPHASGGLIAYVMSLNICAALGEVRHAKTVQNVPLCTP